VPRSRAPGAHGPGSGSRPREAVSVVPVRSSRRRVRLVSRGTVRALLKPALTGRKSALRLPLYYQATNTNPCSSASNPLAMLTLPNITHLSPVTCALQSDDGRVAAPGRGQASFKPSPPTVLELATRR
jgi:hypothetical protein